MKDLDKSILDVITEAQFGVKNTTGGNRELAFEIADVLNGARLEAFFVDLADAFAAKFQESDGQHKAADVLAKKLMELSKLARQV